MHEIIASDDLENHREGCRVDTGARMTMSSSSLASALVVGEDNDVDEDGSVFAARRKLRECPCRWAADADFEWLPTNTEAGAVIRGQSTCINDKQEEK